MTENMKLDDIKALLPEKKIPWLESTEVKVFRGNKEIEGKAKDLIESYSEEKLWVWPSQTIFFFSDLHGDKDAFKRSLLATKVVLSNKDRLELTKEGKKAKFIIGGDLFDKGPSNLELLDFLKEFIKSGADVDLIAGNHDIRTFVGIHYMGVKSLKTSHLFTRVGGKSLTLFKEIYNRYEKELPNCPYSEDELKEILFPDEKWLQNFPNFAKNIIHPEKLEKETKRIREKILEIQEMAQKLELSLKDIWSCVIKAREIFLDKKGKYYWVFEKLELAKIYGSFLFVHGGIDDKILPDLFKRGPSDLKKWFHEKLRKDAFDLYHGEIGNCFRTKYRSYDNNLSQKGIKELHERGIFAIVHGHLNQRRGQRIVYRENLLHFQCDCSLDINTRKKENISNLGLAVTIFRSSGVCEAISSDYDKIKIFKTKGSIEDVEKGKKMKKSKRIKFEHESIEDINSIVKYFETIISGLKKGSLTFGNNKKTTTLSPSGLIKLKINADNNEKKAKLGIDLEWREKKVKTEKDDKLIVSDENNN